MSDEVKTALAGIKSAWKNMLTAKDKETFDAWSKEQKRLESILYKEKRKLYIHFRNTSEEFRASRRINKDERRSPAERQIRIQQYQHEYYLKVTKPKRAERRKVV